MRVVFFVAKTAIGLKLAYSHYVNPIAIFFRGISMTKEEAIRFGENILKVADNTTDADAIEFTKMAIEAFKQEPKTDELNKISAEINGMYRVILKGTPKDDWAVKWNDCVDEVLQIIDKYKTERKEDGATFNNLCNSCSNIGCEFQSSIVRTKCAFYMPPHIEPDNCGNYVVMQSTSEVFDNRNTI